MAIGCLYRTANYHVSAVHAFQPGNRVSLSFVEETNFDVSSWNNSRLGKQLYSHVWKGTAAIKCFRWSGAAAGHRASASSI